MTLRNSALVESSGAPNADTPLADTPLADTPIRFMGVSLHPKAKPEAPAQAELRRGIRTNVPLAHEPSLY